MPLRPTRVLAKFYADGPGMHAILREATDKMPLPLAGGVLIQNGVMRILGAIQKLGSWPIPKSRMR